MMLFALVVGITMVPGGVVGQEVEGEDVKEEAEAFNPKETIFEHLSDEYWWTIAGKAVLPLPVIVRDNEGSWHVFCSSRLRNGQSYEGFHISHSGAYERKIVGVDANGQEYRPLDFSITKTAAGIIISAVVTLLLVFSLARYYRRRGMKAPRQGMGFLEMIVEMIYKEVVVSVLGKDAKKFASYLLTLFFFIFISNLIGLISVFPGGANVSGNISVTMVLALCTFVVVNVSGNRAYWKDIFWPDVPKPLKFPFPLLPIIELFGVFTKPIALMIRLFANMLGGHLIMLVLICMIFLFSAMGAFATGVSSVFSIAFVVFMNLIHVLIAFIQAYVFTLLSTIFIGLARPVEEHK